MSKTISFLYKAGGIAFESKKHAHFQNLKPFGDAAGTIDVEPASSNQVWPLSFTSINLSAARNKKTDWLKLKIISAQPDDPLVLLLDSVSKIYEISLTCF